MSQLYALVPESGEVKFVRVGDCAVSFFADNEQTCKLVKTLLSGETTCDYVVANPIWSIANVCRALLCKYDILYVGKLPVADPVILNLCFEDFADEALTLELTLVAKRTAEVRDAAALRDRWEPIREVRLRDRWNPCGSAKLRQTTALLSPNQPQLESVWERVWVAYKEEMQGAIEMPDKSFNPQTPFVVADIMAHPCDLFLRQLEEDKEGQRPRVIKTYDWTLLRLPDALMNLYNGSMSRWKTLRAREGDSSNLVCLQSMGIERGYRAWVSRYAEYRLRIISQHLPSLYQKRRDIFL